MTVVLSLVPAGPGRHVVLTSKAPLYFQHDGHSRTIVGIESRRRSRGAGEDTFLLVLDPGHGARELADLLQVGHALIPSLLETGCAFI